MHGEYKTPGGKLVRVDFSLADSRLRQVVVSGDFFLYPDDALDAITAAVEGLPASLSEDELTAAIDAAIPAGTEWLGSSPRALAIAIGRALASQDETDV
jgi:lipoate-protein ligase A